MEHKCQELAKANQDSENNCKFTIEYYLCHKHDDINNITRWVWLLLNNDDDYYRPPYINFCPFCGEDLNKTKHNEVFQEEPYENN